MDQSRCRPRPPQKSKVSFYEGPPQRPGTIRGRFSKVPSVGNAAQMCGYFGSIDSLCCRLHVTSTAFEKAVLLRKTLGRTTKGEFSKQHIASRHTSGLAHAAMISLVQMLRDGI